MKCVIKEELDLKNFGELEPGDLFVVCHKPYVKLCCNYAFAGDNPDYILAVNLDNGKVETFARGCWSREVKGYSLDITI